MITTPSLEQYSVEITETILVRATLEKTFSSLIAQMGRLNETPDGKPLPMRLEPHPGGRWFRDLGGDNGHLWGHVQAIKRPTLLEICGPLFMSYPVASNMMYRLKEVDGGTEIAFRLTPTIDGKTRLDFEHVGLVPGLECYDRCSTGWNYFLASLRQYAETGSGTPWVPAQACAA